MSLKIEGNSKTHLSVKLANEAREVVALETTRQQILRESVGISNNKNVARAASGGDWVYPRMLHHVIGLSKKQRNGAALQSFHELGRDRRLCL